MYNMKINNVNIKTMKNRWYLSSDNKAIQEKINNTYYSQIGQDEYYINNIINNKKNGIFLDIGAHDGITLSNTYYLESILGWKGICVEPNPEIFQKCKKNRKSIICNKAIYEKSNVIINFIIPCEGNVEGGLEQLGGIEGKIREKSLYNDFKHEYSKIKTIQVNTININDLLDQYI